MGVERAKILLELDGWEEAKGLWERTVVMTNDSASNPARQPQSDKVAAA